MDQSPGRFAHQRSLLIWCGAALNLLVGSCIVSMEIYKILWVGSSCRPSLPKNLGLIAIIVITPKQRSFNLMGMSCFSRFSILESPDFSGGITHVFAFRTSHVGLGWACVASRSSKLVLADFLQLKVEDLRQPGSQS